VNDDNFINSSDAISIKNLVKFYGNINALNGVDLKVNRGEIYGFLGPNGAGKTTTIRCMLDLIRPQSGWISVLGLNPQEKSEFIKARVGYLPGELHLDENMTAMQILRFFSNLRGNSPDWKFINQLSERLKLELTTPIRNFSKGNKQKVGIVASLMNRPELLLLDEPTGGLDPLMQQEVLSMLIEARNYGATVFLSSHIISEVQAIADRVAIIRKGKIIKVVETDTLLKRSVRRVRIRFKEDIDTEELYNLPGVELIAEDDNLVVSLKYEGEMDDLIKVVAKYPVNDFETEGANLEEIFLEYYEGQEGN